MVLVLSTLIEVQDVTVEFTIFNAKSRSFKEALLTRSSGGKIGINSSDRVFVRALDGINVTFRRGDRVGLIGRNGAGKTTLLRVLAGVYEPTAGVVRRTGRTVSLLNFMLGMDPEASGRENIFIRGTLLGLSPDELYESSTAIGEFAGIGSYLEFPVRTYSLGMRMRLAFAISTWIKPDIILLDEWIGFGDQEFTKRAEQRMQELLDRAGIMVLSSHSEGLIERLCNRCILLEGGRIVEDGSASEALRAYARLQQTS
jgi:lipopolysaccharide transport system ATP-binding protein